jgi:hypothetical protein
VVHISSDKLEQNTEIYSDNTCQKLHLHDHFCRTNVLKSSVMNVGIKLFCNLLNQIRNVEKLSILEGSSYPFCYTIHSTR